MYGTNLPGGTKWMLLPDLPTVRDGNIGMDDERREADLWLPDLGEITNATYCKPHVSITRLASILHAADRPRPRDPPAHTAWL